MSCENPGESYLKPQRFYMKGVRMFPCYFKKNGILTILDQTNHENTFANSVSAWEALNDEDYNSKRITSNLKGAFSSICHTFNAKKKCDKTPHSNITGNEGCVIHIASGNCKDLLKIVKRQ